VHVKIASRIVSYRIVTANATAYIGVLLPYDTIRDAILTCARNQQLDNENKKKHKVKNRYNYYYYYYLFICLLRPKAAHNMSQFQRQKKRQKQKKLKFTKKLKTNHSANEIMKS